MGILQIEFEKNIGISEISTLEFGNLKNLMGKQKCLNLETKMPYLGIFDQKCFIWVFLVENFKNTIVIFGISMLKFVYFQNLRK